MVDTELEFLHSKLFQSNVRYKVRGKIGQKQKCTKKMNLLLIASNKRAKMWIFSDGGKLANMKGDIKKKINFTLPLRHVANILLRSSTYMHYIVQQIHIHIRIRIQYNIFVHT